MIGLKEDISHYSNMIGLKDDMSHYSKLQACSTCKKVILLDFLQNKVLNLHFEAEL